VVFALDAVVDEGDESGGDDDAAGLCEWGLLGDGKYIY